MKRKRKTDSQWTEGEKINWRKQKTWEKGEKREELNRLDESREEKIRVRAFSAEEKELKKNTGKPRQRIKEENGGKKEEEQNGERNEERNWNQELEQI